MNKHRISKAVLGIMVCFVSMLCIRNILSAAGVKQSRDIEVKADDDNIGTLTVDESGLYKVSLYAGYNYNYRMHSGSVFITDGDKKYSLAIPRNESTNDYYFYLNKNVDYTLTGYALNDNIDPISAKCTMYIQKFDYAKFVWSDDNSSCKVKYNLNGLVKEYDCEVTSEESQAPTCTELGSTRYIATYEADQDIKEVEDIPPIGHKYDVLSFRWSDGMENCKLTYLCTNDETHILEYDCLVTSEILKTATCTEVGSTLYTASHDTKTYKNIVNDIPATGHKYGNPIFTWSTDGKSCRVLYTCENDENHTVEYDCSVTSEIIKTASCVEKGVTRYTATYGTDVDTKDVQGVIDENVHSGNVNKIITKATMNSDGQISYTCSYCDKTINTTENIYYPKTITTVTSATYTGSQIKPAVTVKDANGKVIDATNYTLTYGTNKAYGEGTVTVTFKGNYSGSKKLTFKILPKTTSISSLANASTGITIKWAKNDQATGYKIYRSVNGGSYSLVKNITSNATVSYTDTGATTNGAKYDYKIYAYRTSGSTTYTAVASAVKTIYRLTSTISSAANAASGITVKWAKNSAATGYYVYRSVNGVAYTLIKTITSNGTVSYTDTGAKTNGAKYQYKVVAYKTVSGTTYKSAYSAVKTMYRLTSTISSAANAASGITVKWAKNSKATGYYVYRSVNGGSYSRIATIKSYATVSYTDTKATTAGAKYQYKVIAYKTVSGTNYNSASSAIKTTYRLARPAISSASNSAAGKVTVKWNKISKASGYEIKYVTGTTTKTVTVTSGTTVSKVLSSLKKGSTYKIYVRAYRTVSSTKYYSAWSPAKSVKITK